jgi:catechol 2,3-dioxygenase-like lactoylglutathione lyase family enzyme
MKQSLGLVSLVVRDYDEALAFFVGVLGFTLIEESMVPSQAKRWVVVAPPGSSESRLLLARASTDEQRSRIGAQTGGRVFLFLYTDNFWRDYNLYESRGIEFVRTPKTEPYGTVAVFKDLYGNLWDLLEPISKNATARTRVNQPSPNRARTGRELAPVFDAPTGPSLSFGVLGNSESQFRKVPGIEDVGRFPAHLMKQLTPDVLEEAVSLINRLRSGLLDEEALAAVVLRLNTLLLDPY